MTNAEMHKLIDELNEKRPKLKERLYRIEVALASMKDRFSPRSFDYESFGVCRMNMMGTAQTWPLDHADLLIALEALKKVAEADLEAVKTQLGELYGSKKEEKP